MSTEKRATQNNLGKEQALRENPVKRRTLTKNSRGRRDGLAVKSNRYVYVCTALVEDLSSVANTHVSLNSRSRGFEHPHLASKITYTQVGTSPHACIQIQIVLN